MPNKSTTEKGYTGTVIYSGYISDEEFNPKLTESDAIEIYDKMRKTDAQIKASLLSIELPLRAATWTIETASEDNADLKIAEFVENNLQKNSNFTWDHFLRHALKYLQYGFYPFEKVYEFKEGKYYIKKFAPRKPKTIQRWIQNPDGTLKEIEQWVFTPKETYETLTIPNEKLVLFVNDQEGSNWRGESILRSAYRNWKFKDLLIRVDGMRHERQGLGVPKIIKREGDTKVEDETQARKVGETFRAQEKQYVFCPPGWDVEMLDMKGGATTDILASIKFHNTEITSNILAQFMELGKTETGSRSLGGSLRDVFLLSLQATANYIENTINEGMEGRKVIRELVDMNFPNVKLYPKLKASKIANVDYTQVATTLKTLGDGGFLTSTQPLEDWIRQELDLPEMTDEEKDKKEQRRNMPPIIQAPPVIPPKKPDEKPPEEDESKASSCGHKHFAYMEKNDWAFSRKLTDIEKRMNFEEIRDTLKESTGKLIDIAKQYRNDMVNELVRKGVALLAKRKTIKDFETELQNIKVPYQGKMTNEIKKELRNLYQYSQQKAREEMRSQTNLQEPTEAIVEDEDEAKSTISIFAGLAVGVLINQLWYEFQREMIRQKKSPDINSAAFRDALNKLSTQQINNEMKSRALEAFGIARGVEYEKQKENIEKFVRSEVMDMNTCGECSIIDGAEFTFNDNLYSMTSGGIYDRCEGRDKCRGENIAVMK